MPPMFILLSPLSDCLHRSVVRDPELFEEPDKFIPERYLPMFDKSIPVGPKGLPLDPENFAFGYGRRICAGMHYADSMFFVSMARILSAFEIRPAKDANGKDIIPDLKFNSSIVRYVFCFRTLESGISDENTVLDRETFDFPCSITPRSEAHKALFAEYSF